MRALVTGGCGFIGSALVRHLVRAGDQVLNIDKLTYAGDVTTVAEVAASPDYRFEQIDILDRAAMTRAIAAFAPDAIFHLAAESHVDRSIDAPGAFIDTNLRGTFVLLQCALGHWNGLDPSEKAAFRFVHVSTDEVFGSLGPDGHFTEDTPYRPNSPYAASKAGADHLVRAWHATYGLPTVISNCSNNYGPFQHREKLIPTIIRKALSGQPIPIYGDGRNVRDWLYVEDHVAALLAVRAQGRAGDSYVIGGHNEICNLDLARTICALLDVRRPRGDGRPHGDAIAFVTDRPGHDFRYAIDAGKARRELEWRPQHDVGGGLARTVDWYLAHQDWTREAASEDRLGLGLGLGLGASRAAAGAS